MKYRIEECEEGIYEAAKNNDVLRNPADAVDNDSGWMQGGGKK